MADGAAKTGGCLCGGVRFSAILATDEVDACHCGMCRKWTGGVFLGARCDGVTIEAGASVGVYPSSDYGERVFCGTCGTSLFWRMRDGSSAHVAASALDDLSGLVFVREIFIDEKPALYDFANPTRKMTGAQFAEMTAGQQETPGG